MRLQTEALNYLSTRIFEPVLWRGKSRGEIEAEAQAIVDRFRLLALRPEQIKLVSDLVTSAAARTISELRAEQAAREPQLQFGERAAKPV